MKNCKDHFEERRKSSERYRNSEKGKEARKRYNSSEKGKEKNKQYYTSEKVREYNKQWSRKNRYNLSQQGYNELFNKQGGKCVICGEHQREFKKALYVDHDHKTDQIRGLLCHKCNMILGLAHDNILILENAIIYLKTNIL